MPGHLHSEPMFHATVPTAKTSNAASDMERHVCAHFAESKGQRKADEAKRQRVESARDAFGAFNTALMDSEHWQQQRTSSKNLQRGLGRLYRATGMHDATFRVGVVDKVVPYGGHGVMSHKWTDEELPVWWVPKPLVVLTTAPQWGLHYQLVSSLSFRTACDERAHLPLRLTRASSIRP
jgi:hypothetical protein